MAALPYMPLYVADYLADAAHLSTVQHGAYLLLIMNYWQRGEPLPNDDIRLARIARLSPKEWSRNRDVLCEFFAVDENLWRHGRIDSELSRVASKSLKSKAAAQASVQRRFGERSADAKRTLNHTDTDTDTEETVAKATGAKSAANDSEAQFWSGAKDYIGGETKSAGSLIGKWRKDHGKERVAEAITRAQLERPMQRIPFIIGTLKTLAVQEPTGDGLAARMNSPC